MLAVHKVDIMQSLLRMGSLGPDVVTIQKALNEAGQSVFDQLTPDGQFGMKTHGRVLEFQRRRGLVADGIVGSNTQSALQQFIDQVTGFVEKLQPPPGEATARQRVVQTAEQFFQAHGWRPFDKVGGDNARIAANKCSDPVSRARQGGAVLAVIWGIAGVVSPPPRQCLQISTTAESNYLNGLPGRNQWDIPSWCGIFALSVYKRAGLRLSAWPLKHKGFSAKPEFQAVTSGGSVQPGDLGIFDFRPNETNHHFIVVGVSGDIVTSVEANVSQPFGNDRFQTIAKRTKFSVNQIMKDKFSAFVSPIWDQVL